MHLNHHLINTLIILALLAYLVYLLFFADRSTEVKNLVTDVVNNRFGRLVIILAIVFLTVDNKLKIGGPCVGILLLVVYLLTLTQMNESFSGDCKLMPNPNTGFNPHPYRPTDSTLASGVPDPIPQEKDGSPSGPCAMSGVSNQMGMR